MPENSQWSIEFKDQKDKKRFLEICRIDIADMKDSNKVWLT